MAIIINGNITINGNVSILEQDDHISKAKDNLLNILFYKRNCADLDGREGWITLLDMYFMGNYEDMCEKIETFKNGTSKRKCLECLNAIMHA